MLCGRATLKGRLVCMHRCSVCCGVKFVILSETRQAEFSGDESWTQLTDTG